jgi:hypothetical protein
MRKHGSVNGKNSPAFTRRKEESQRKSKAAKKARRKNR